MKYEVDAGKISVNIYIYIYSQNVKQQNVTGMCTIDRKMTLLNRQINRN